MQYIYSLGLIFSFAAMGYIDWRWRVALFRNFKSTLIVVAITFVTLLMFDVAGLALNIYSVGHRVIGIFIISQDFPIEEIFLLIFFAYFSLVMLRIHR